MKKIFALLLTCLALVGCDRVASNVHVLTTTDCGANWERLDVGKSIPKHAGNVCGYNTALPNWPMAGDAMFKTGFAKGVLANVKLSYTYSITGPLAFIKEARYLGKMGGSLELSADSVGGRFEMAENIIIDKLLREVTTELTRNLEVVDSNPAEIEDAIFKNAKDVLDKKGVTIADMALVIETDDQTRLAIDTATAIRVYRAANIEDLGKAVIAARAGANRISVVTGESKHDK